MKSEQDLIKTAAKNPESFALLYDMHYKTIFNYVLRRTGDFDASRDICSEVFLKAFMKIKGFRWKGISISHWFYRIASNEINQYFRTKKYRPSVSLEMYDENIPGARLTAEKEAAEDELTKHEAFLNVQKTIKTLPYKYQEVLALKYFEQLKIREIAVVLGKKEGTVKSLLSRGVKMLKEKVKPQPFSG